MTAAPAPHPAAASARAWPAVLLLLLAGVAAYGNSLAADFVFDDHDGILGNRHVNGEQPLFTDLLATRRIVGRLSLGINYALAGPNAPAFHAVNLGIHLAAGLTLFGLLRRSLARAADITARAAVWLAFAIALLWLAHPLTTQAVTYTVQRYESLMALFSLVSLYALARAADAAAKAPWLIVTWLACAASIATKEVAIVLPLILLLYDRAFLAGTFTDALRRRWPLHLICHLFWAIPFVFGVGDLSQPGGSAGFGMTSLTPLQYARTQPGVILFYLKLCVWPDLLSIDHFWPIARTPAAIVPPLLAILILLGATLVALIRWPRLGFVAAAFFLVLAPTSSFLPIFDMAVEHRMYLPLAAVVTLAVLAVHRGMARLTAGDVALVARGHRLLIALLAAAALALGTATARRNMDYRSEVALWQSAARKRPNNPRAHRNLSAAQAAQGDLAGATASLRRSLALFDADPVGHRSLARMLIDRGQVDAAIAQYQVAARYAPHDLNIPLELGAIYLRQLRYDDAIATFEHLLTIHPNSHDAYYGLGEAWLRKGDTRGLAMIDKAVAFIVTNPAGHARAGQVLARLDYLDEAQDFFERALELAPHDATHWSNMGNLALARKDAARAVTLQRKAVELDPRNLEYQRRLAAALASLPTPDAAQRQEAMRLALAAAQRQPNAPAYLETLALAFASAGQYRDAELVLRRMALLASQAGQTAAAADFRRRAEECAAKTAAARAEITTTSPVGPDPSTP